jgi:hypothetical protein
MGSGTFVDDFEAGLEFTPVDGQPNVYFMHPRRASDNRAREEMSSEDWDKFEKDISDAFEQVP